MVASSTSGPDAIDELTAAWVTFGGDLTYDLTLNYGLCVIEDCNGMSFVGLRTEMGPRPVCMRHYDEIAEAMPAPA